MFPKAVFGFWPGKHAVIDHSLVELAGGLRILHWFLLLIFHARVQNVDLIWLLQASSHFLLLLRDWLHQRPNEIENNLFKGKHLAQWDGSAGTVTKVWTF